MTDLRRKFPLFQDINLDRNTLPTILAGKWFLFICLWVAGRGAGFDTNFGVAEMGYQA
jgi:hypothetical protein